LGGLEPRVGLRASPDAHTLKGGAPSGGLAIMLGAVTRYAPHGVACPAALAPLAPLARNTSGDRGAGRASRAAVPSVFRGSVPILPRGPYRQETDLLVAPITLHRSLFRGGTQGVGLSYSSMMARFLSAGEQARRDAEYIQARMWRPTEYEVRRVQRRLLEQHQRETALVILYAVMDMHREEADPAEIARRYSRSIYWVTQKFGDCNRLASHSRSCACRPCVRGRRRAQHG
jgi:hypothetical protein